MAKRKVSSKQKNLSESKREPNDHLPVDQIKKRLLWSLGLSLALLMVPVVLWQMGW